MTSAAEHVEEVDAAATAEPLTQLHQLRAALGRLLTDIRFPCQIRMLFQHGSDHLIHGLHGRVAQLHNKLHLARNHIDRSRKHLERAHGTNHIRRSGSSPIHKLGNDPAGAYQGIIPQMHGCTACMVGTAGNRHAVAHDTYNAACQADLRPLRLQKSPLLNVQLQIALILGQIPAAGVDLFHGKTVKGQIGPHGPVDFSAGEGFTAKGTANDIALLLGEGDHLNGVPVLIAQLPKALHTFDPRQYAVGSVIDAAARYGVDVGANADGLSFAGKRTHQISYRIHGCLESCLLHALLYIGPPLVIDRRIGQSCGPFPWHKTDLPQPGQAAG